MRVYLLFVTFFFMNVIFSENIYTGLPISDREGWSPIIKNIDRDYIIGYANRLKNNPLPEMTEELYLHFSKTGNRTRWQDVSGDRRKRIKYYVLAEIINNSGEYIDVLEELLMDLCHLNTWVKPSHDKKLLSYNNEEDIIDLASSTLAWELALVTVILEDVISPHIVELVRENIFTRVLDPYRAMINGSIKESWWLEGTNNWNAVCLAGVTGAALTLIEDELQQEFYIDAAKEHIEFFLSGFNEDGYCTEGVGYWNYGFGHFVLLSELLYKVSSGELDLILDEDAYKPALYGFNIEITDGVSPTFADCSVSAIPDRGLLDYLSYKLDIPGKYYKLSEYKPYNRSLQNILFSLINKKDEKIDRSHKSDIRSYYPNTGLLVGRNNLPTSISFVAKGGHNGEHHNHNDVGSYSVVLGTDSVVVDPGSEVYTARTFSKDRYKSDLLNSFGHSVPVINGNLQESGREAYSVTRKVEFSDKRDYLELDISNAYSDKNILTLNRSFEYSREGRGSLIVKDSFSFSKKSRYEGVIITHGTYKILNGNNIVILGDEEALLCKINSGGEPYTISSSSIDEDSKSGRVPLRINIEFDNKIHSGYLELTYTPFHFIEDNHLKNGGFDYGSLGWSISKDKMGELSTREFYNGDTSLLIVDESVERGSSIYSTPIKYNSNEITSLSGWYFPKSGSGLGIYIKVYQKDGEELKELSSKTGTLSGSTRIWEFFSFHIPHLPSEADHIKVWIHSFNKSRVEGYLDNLRLE